MNAFPNKLFLRRGEARESLGVSDQVFGKLVEAGALTPVYLVWEIRDRQGRLVFTANEAKAKTYCQDHSGLEANPSGQAYYRRADVVKFAEQNGEVVR